MSNHYHLALELDKPEEISSFIAGLQRSYSCYHHRTYGTSGFLWQGRFKLQPVQKDIYLPANTPIAALRFIAWVEMTGSPQKIPYSLTLVRLPRTDKGPTGSFCRTLTEKKRQTHQTRK